MRPVKYSHAPAELGRSAADGWCHVRYNHSCRASVIDLVCPACGHRAVASAVLDERFGGPLGAVAGDGFIEMGAVRWGIACTHCAHRAEATSIDVLTPFFWEFDAAGCRVWAWNRDHLQMLLKVLRGESVAGDTHECLRTYIPREWLLRGNRPRIAKEIARRLAGGTA